MGIHVSSTTTIYGNFGDNPYAWGSLVLIEDTTNLSILFCSLNLWKGIIHFLYIWLIWQLGMKCFELLTRNLCFYRMNSNMIKTPTDAFNWWRFTYFPIIMVTLRLRRLRCYIKILRWIFLWRRGNLCCFNPGTCAKTQTVKVYHKL